MEKNNETDSRIDKKDHISRRFQEAIIFLLTGVGTGVASWLYHSSVIETSGIVILVLPGICGVIFSMEQSVENNTFLFDNRYHLWRFTFLYFISLVGSLVFPMLPEGGWPFLAVFIGLMLFSNQTIGIFAGTVLLMISGMLHGGADCHISFFVYFVGGLVGVTLFSYVNTSFKIGFPLIISLMVQMVCLSVQEVLYVNEQLNLQMFLIPAVNLLVCLILLLVILKYFSFSIVYKNQDMYMDINDPECPLLVELKSASKEEYYHAVHTAYMCDRIAKRLNLDDAVVKACGYYHRIGILKGENTWENLQLIMEENHFPQRVREILKEYVDSTEPMISKETIILLFSDTIISSISYLFSKDPQIQLDYPKVIGGIFKRRVESGVIDRSDLTFGELQEMKEILVEEKLYYDFLR